MNNHERRNNILKRLLNGERFTPKEYAELEEINKTEKTIQNDMTFLKEKYPDIKFEKDKNRRYFIENFDEINLQKDKTILSDEEKNTLFFALNPYKEEEKFSSTVNSIFKKTIGNIKQNTITIHHNDLQDIHNELGITMSKLDDMIKENQIIIITCQKSLSKILPLQFIPLDGIWYIFSLNIDEEKYKIYKVDDIELIEKTDEKKVIEKWEINNKLKKVVSPYFEDGSFFQIKIKVNPNIAYNFKEKTFIPTQFIEEILKDGSLIISFWVTHEEDVDNIIKSWLPDIIVYEPDWYAIQVKNELKSYLIQLDKYLKDFYPTQI